MQKKKFPKLWIFVLTACILTSLWEWIAVNERNMACFNKKKYSDIFIEWSTFLQIQVTRCFLSDHKLWEICIFASLHIYTTMGENCENKKKYGGYLYADIFIEYKIVWFFLHFIIAFFLFFSSWSYLDRFGIILSLRNTGHKKGSRKVQRIQNHDKNSKYGH